MPTVSRKPWTPWTAEPECKEGGFRLPPCLLLRLDPIRSPQSAQGIAEGVFYAGGDGGAAVPALAFAASSAVPVT